MESFVTGNVDTVRFCRINLNFWNVPKKSLSAITSSKQKADAQRVHYCLPNLKLATRDVPNIRFWFARYLAIFYYLVPDPAEILNSTGYCSQIFYSQYNSVRWLERECRKIWLALQIISKHSLTFKPAYIMHCNVQQQHKSNYWH